MSQFTRRRAKARKEKAERAESIDKGFKHIISALEDMRDNPEKYIKEIKKKAI